MGKDYLDNIEEFDMNSLPNVFLSEEEIKRIKDNIVSVISELKKKHKNMKFEITLDEAFKIRQNLGEKAERKIFGIENAKLMRAFITEEVKSKYGINKEDIVYSYYTRISGEAYWFWKSTIYYEIILTKEKLLIIGFDADVNVTVEKWIGFDEIKAAGTIAKEGEKTIVGDGCGAIDLKDGTRFYIEYKMYEKEKEFFKLIEKLREVNVKDVKSEASRNNKSVIIFYIVTFVIMIWFLSSML